MSIDLARFHQAFFEESFERMDAMEQGLLQLEGGADNAETINDIFRAAHSIKGGAATFGFAAVAGFTHHVETLLDSVRNGSRGVDKPLVALLLRASDQVRALLNAARDGGNADAALSLQLQAELQAALAGDTAAVVAAPACAAVVVTAAAATSGWRIVFKPHRDLFASGNDPLRILRGLGTLGELESELHFAADLPGFAEIDPQQCYLSWTLRLCGAATEAEVREMFAWVEDECDLSIAPLAAGPVESAEPVHVNVVPITAATPVAAAAVAAPAAKSRAPAESSIRVSIDKIDGLINLVGELVITQASLTQYTRGLDPLVHERLLASVQQLEHTARLLQESVMSTRMLPIDSVFSRFPRMVHDLATRLNKQVRLQTVGEATELDKSVIEKIGDPLTHLVRNCIDHGIELPAVRVAAGKPAQGTMTLTAAHQGGQIVIEVIDDGRGLSRQRILDKARANGLVISDNASDSEVWNLIFAPGFSTAAEVTDVSGRGVGMDVVRRNIESLGGEVELRSQEGEGTSVRIRLPLTLAIVDGMFVDVGGETFIVPLIGVVESLQPAPEQIRRIAGQGQVLRLRDEYIPVISARELYRVPGAAREACQSIAVIIEADGFKLALLVDDLIGQQQAVIKSLEAHFRRVFGVAGATILGDGRVALIIDVTEVVRTCGRSLAA
ncbi:MAG: chemotaxis protein [Hydrocarboniphaga sp.]|uniref:chemotaxis protein CheA n=1 Tax=Hydrocarboniphaga sp. TaxID=2033016 RepID=UPI00262F5FDD|nr:chemotaxis protein CheA [Hydrocarboniphaga sp.]MDB5973079.1 chemotaxis protein [Hydrocarboniphaga sp.]